MMFRWSLLSFVSISADARFRGGRVVHAAPDIDSTSGFQCPLPIPTGPGKSTRTQGPYFDSLFETLLHGNGQTKYYAEENVQLVGCKDGTFQEGWVKDHKPQYRCLYAMMLKENCGGSPSRLKKRKEQWELTCLDPDKSTSDAYKLMTKKEFKYFRGINATVTDPASSVGARFNLHFDMTGYKELACLQMKVIDDECIKPVKAPSLLPDWYWTSGQPPTPEPHIPKPNTGSKWFEDKLEAEYDEANPEGAAQLAVFPATSSNSTIRLALQNSTVLGSSSPSNSPASEKPPSKRSSMYKHLVAGNFTLHTTGMKRASQ